MSQMKKLLWINILLLSCGLLSAQVSDDEVVFDGEILTKMVTDDGDTIFVAKLDDVSITSPRTFANPDDYKKYRRYRYYAPIVYPYAKEAIRIFRETEVATQELNNRKRKKYIKKLQKELKEEFEEPLKKLTKIQGYMLQKMIERETGESMYDLVKGLRGGFTASYWSTFSRFFGYKLKGGYVKGDDPILDAVLEDFDVSHDF